jgi:hypothetical protein
MRNERLALLAIVAFLLGIGACDNSRTRIVGQWRAIGEPTGMVWEFFPDGTLLAGTTHGRYTFGDRDRIKIQTPSATFVHQIHFSDNQMTWQEAKGSTLRFERVK